MANVNLKFIAVKFAKIVLGHNIGAFQNCILVYLLKNLVWFVKRKEALQKVAFYLLTHLFLSINIQMLCIYVCASACMCLCISF